MSYRYEGEDLVFDGWERGIADGPYSIFSPSALGPINQTGTVDLSYGNIYGIPGEFSVQFPLAASTVNTTGGVSLGTPVQKATQIPSGNGGNVTKYYMLDGKGQVFLASGSGAATTWTYKGRLLGGTSDVLNNNGLVWWQGYLFGFRDNTIQYSNDDGVSWTDWAGMGYGTVSDYSHYAIASQVSDTMYFCDGSNVGSVTLTPGSTFSPTNNATFTFQGSAVSIPLYDSANCLAEINGQVLIGGALNRVYPWDAQNLSGSGITSLVGLPLFLGDSFVQRIVVVNSNAYIFTSFSQTPVGTPLSLGNIYITNGSTIDLFKKMPNSITTIAGASSDIQEPYWQFGDAMYHRNKLYFGAVAISNKTGATISDTGGVWCIDLNSQVLFRSNFVSSGNTALVSVINPFAIGPSAITGLGYFCGANGVMNYTSNTMSTSARFISDKVPVGTKLVPKTFAQIEVKTAVALVSGESIDIKVVTDVNPSGLTVGSMTSGDGMSKVFSPLNFQGIQWLQLQATLNPTNTNPTYVRLREIRLR